MYMHAAAYEVIFIVFVAAASSMQAWFRRVSSRVQAWD